MNLMGVEVEERALLEPRTGRIWDLDLGRGGQRKPEKRE